MGGGGLSILFSRQQIRIRSGGRQYGDRGERLRAHVPRTFFLKTPHFFLENSKRYKSFFRPQKTNPNPPPSLAIRGFPKILLKFFHLSSI